MPKDCLLKNFESLTILVRKSTLICTYPTLRETSCIRALATTANNEVTWF